MTLCCDEGMTGVMIDRFGKDVAMRRIEGTQIRARVEVAVSRQFFGWLTGLGADVRIESPEHVAKAYEDYLQEILSRYQTAERIESPEHVAKAYEDYLQEILSRYQTAEKSEENE